MGSIWCDITDISMSHPTLVCRGIWEYVVSHFSAVKCDTRTRPSAPNENFCPQIWLFSNFSRAKMRTATRRTGIGFVRCTAETNARTRPRGDIQGPSAKCCGAATRAKMRTATLRTGIAENFCTAAKKSLDKVGQKTLRCLHLSASRREPRAACHWHRGPAKSQA